MNINHLKGSTQSGATVYIQPNVGVQSEIQHYMLDRVLNERNTLFTDNLIQTAPFGYSIPNPVLVNFGTPYQPTIMNGVKAPAVSNGNRGGCN